MGFPHRRPPPHLSMRWVFLLRLQLLFRVSPVHRGGHRFPCRRTGRQTRCPLLPRFLAPSAFSQPCGATYPRWFPNPPVVLRPQGFAPSRRFAPRSASQACFIPVPLLGFAPRGFVPRATPYAVSGAGPLLGFPTSSEEPVRPSRGSAHRTKLAHDSRGLARSSCRMPPRASSPSRFLASGGRRTGEPATSPHVLSRLGLHADLAAGTPGFLSPETQPLSLEIGATSMEFSTSLVLSPVWERRRAGV